MINRLGCSVRSRQRPGRIVASFYSLQLCTKYILIQGALLLQEPLANSLVLLLSTAAQARARVIVNQSIHIITKSIFLKERHTFTETDRQTDIQNNRQAGRPTDRQAGGHTGEHADRQTDMQAGGQTGRRHTERHHKIENKKRRAVPLYF